MRAELDRLLSARAWDAAVDVLDELTRLEPDPSARGALVERAGTLCRDHLAAIDRAVDYFERALDCYFADGERPDAERRLAQLRPLHALDAIHAEAGDARAREACYLRMIDRLPPDEPLLPRVLDALGELYRSCLRQPAKAIAAFEAAARLEPGRRERRALLAELHLAAGPSSVDRAIRHHRTILADDPRDAASLRALRALYTEAGEYDKAWCVCAAMAYLGCASDEEQRYYETYQATGALRGVAPLDGRSWSLVRHRDQDPRVGEILATVAREVAWLTARPHRHFGLVRKRRRDTNGDQLALTRVLEDVARTLGVALPDLYLQPDEPGELLLANTCERRWCVPSLVARADALRGRRGRELGFIAGRALTLLRDEQVIRLAAPTADELRGIFAAALALAGEGAASSPLATRLAQRLSIEARVRLVDAVARAGHAPHEIDPAAWRAGAELTAERMGFVFCGDVGVAARTRVRGAPATPGTALGRRIDELLRYAVSEDYFALRAHLGVAIGDGARAVYGARVAA